MHIHGGGWLPNIDVIPSKQPNIDKAVGGRTRPLVVSDWHWIDFTQGPSFLAGQVQWIMCDASIKRSIYNNESILESRVSFLSLLTWGQKAAYIRRNLPTVERVFKILKLIVISPHDSIKCQSWGGFEKITFYHYKKAHFYTVGQNQFF